jgi:hypothetical protein
MGAETAGRKLGIGLRLAARAARDQAARMAATGPSSAQGTNGASQPGSSPMTSGKTQFFDASRAKSQAKGLAEGTKRFGQAVVGPVAHTGGILWLEITGLFFLLFAGFFAQNVYKFRAAYKSGPEHFHFLVYSGLTLLFLGFTLMNFWKARQKEKKNRARRAMAASTRS